MDLKHDEWKESLGTENPLYTTNRDKEPDMNGSLRQRGNSEEKRSRSNSYSSSGSGSSPHSHSSDNNSKKEMKESTPRIKGDKLNRDSEQDEDIVEDRKSESENYKSRDDLLIKTDKEPKKGTTNVSHKERTFPQIFSTKKAASSSHIEIRSRNKEGGSSPNKSNKIFPSIFKQDKEIDKEKSENENSATNSALGLPFKRSNTQNLVMNVMSIFKRNPISTATTAASASSLPPTSATNKFAMLKRRKSSIFGITLGSKPSKVAQRTNPVGYLNTLTKVVKAITIMKSRAGLSKLSSVNEKQVQIINDWSYFETNMNQGSGKDRENKSVWMKILRGFNKISLFFKDICN